MSKFNLGDYIWSVRTEQHHSAVRYGVVTGICHGTEDKVWYALNGNLWGMVREGEACGSLPEVMEILSTMAESQVKKEDDCYDGMVVLPTSSDSGEVVFDE